MMNWGENFRISIYYKIIAKGKFDVYVFADWIGLKEPTLMGSEYFRLGEKEMSLILDEVLAVVRGWKSIGAEVGISEKERHLMEGAFLDIN